MRLERECLVCCVKQAIRTGERLLETDAEREKLIRETLKMLSKMDYGFPAPVAGREIQRLIKEITGNPDPYLEEKIEFNSFAQKILPVAKNIIENSEQPIRTAMKMAIAGNIMDSGLARNITIEETEETINQAVCESLGIDHSEKLFDKLAKAKKVLYLGDNAGEVFFDKLFIDKIGPEKVTFVVKSEPILNDVLFEEANISGIADNSSVIANGTDIPGTWLRECSDEFKTKFEEADLIISKGQGNFETLSECKNKEIVFLLKAKCSVIARMLNCTQNSPVVLCNQKYN